jgi:hypothetical protein
MKKHLSDKFARLGYSEPNQFTINESTEENYG